MAENEKKSESDSICCNDGLDTLFFFFISKICIYKYCQRELFLILLFLFVFKCVRCGEMTLKSISYVPKIIVQTTWAAFYCTRLIKDNVDLLLCC